MPDNRVVLPLDRARLVAHGYCDRVCPSPPDPMHPDYPGEHDDVCLVPQLEERDRMLTGVDLSREVLPDCRDGKCIACSGCACVCHRQHNLDPAMRDRDLPDAVAALFERVGDVVDTDTPPMDRGILWPTTPSA